MFLQTTSTLLLISSLLYVASSLSYPIIGTNQTKFYTEKGESRTEITSPTDEFYGQDPNYSNFKPAYRNNGDGTITDLNTGLMWQAARGEKMSVMTAITNAASFRLAGYTDWRMPTVKELYSLIQFTGQSASTAAACTPYIDTNYFEIVFGDATGARVIDGQDYSSSIYVSNVFGNMKADFGVNFIDGRIKGYGFNTNSKNTQGNKYARYVRGNKDYGINQFVDNSDGTISDLATGLMWSQEDSKVGMNWKDALAWAQKKNSEKYLGHSDWRVPNAKELQSLVDYTRSPDTTDSAAINPLFSSTPIVNEGGVKDFAYYWTSTTHLEGGQGAIAVYVAFGRALGYMKLGGSSYYTLYDVHGAGAQRSDPKSGSPSDYYLGVDGKGEAVYGRGPQGDVLRITNFVRLVRNI